MGDPEIFQKTDRAMQTRTYYLQQGMQYKQDDRCITHLYTYVVSVNFNYVGEYESYDLVNSGLPQSFITGSPTLVHMNLEADLGVCNCHRCTTQPGWWGNLAAFWQKTLFGVRGGGFSQSD